MRRALSFEADAGLAMRDGKRGEYEHLSAQARAAWAHFREELSKERL